jgi:hypothetical protein
MAAQGDPQPPPDPWPALAVVDGKLVRGRFVGYKFQAMPQGTESEDARERVEAWEDQKFGR